MVTDSRLGKEVQAEKDTLGAVCPRTATPTPLPCFTGAEAANVQANEGSSLQKWKNISGKREVFSVHAGTPHSGKGDSWAASSHRST